MAKVITDSKATTSAGATIIIVSPEEQAIRHALATVEKCLASLLKRASCKHPTSEDVTLCTSLLRFGHCDNYRCTDKHVLRPVPFDDSLLGILCGKLVLLEPWISVSSQRVFDVVKSTDLLPRLEKLAAFSGNLSPLLLNYVLGHFGRTFVAAVSNKKAKGKPGKKATGKNIAGELPTPLRMDATWLEAQTAEFNDSLHRYKAVASLSSLHDAIIRHASTQIEEQKALERLSEEVCLALRSAAAFTCSEILPFGSSANGFGSGSSDLDLVCIREDDGNGDGFLQSVAEAVPAAGFVVTELIGRARVPVLRMAHASSGLAVDMCLNNRLALENTALLRRYARYPELRQLALAVKHWSKQRGVAAARNSTITSYAWTVLVVFFMQQIEAVPNLQIDTSSDVATLEASLLDLSLSGGEDGTTGKDSKSSSSDRDLGELLFAFFCYYGCPESGFEFNKYAASIRLGRRVLRRADRTSNVALRAEGWRFVIEDPFEDHDLGKVVRDCRGHLHILAELRRGMEVLLRGGDDCWERLVETNLNVPLLPMLCRGCNSDRHTLKDCPLNVDICFRCRQHGHVVKDCGLCAFCMRSGHTRSQCPVLANKKAVSNAPLQSPLPKQAHPQQKTSNLKPQTPLEVVRQATSEAMVGKLSSAIPSTAGAVPKKKKSRAPGTSRPPQERTDVKAVREIIDKAFGDSKPVEPGTIFSSLEAGALSEQPTMNRPAKNVQRKGAELALKSAVSVTEDTTGPVSVAMSPKKFKAIVNKKLQKERRNRRRRQSKLDSGAVALPVNASGAL